MRVSDWYGGVLAARRAESQGYRCVDNGSSQETLQRHPKWEPFRSFSHEMLIFLKTHSFWFTYAASGGDFFFDSFGFVMNLSTKFSSINVPLRFHGYFVFPGSCCTLNAKILSFMAHSLGAIFLSAEAVHTIQPAEIYAFTAMLFLMALTCEASLLTVLFSLVWHPPLFFRFPEAWECWPHVAHSSAIHKCRFQCSATKYSNCAAIWNCIEHVFENPILFGCPYAIKSPILDM